MPSQISGRKFFDVWFANAKEIRTDALLHHILQELGNPSFSDDVIRSLKVTITSFCQKIEQKWSKSGRHRDRFPNTNLTHSWIRFFECILHISYRLEIKSWQARGAENKNKVAEKKKEVQEKFRSELGLLVDMPKQQTGNTNDGNSARKFFRNSEKSAEITGC